MLKMSSRIPSSLVPNVISQRKQELQSQGVEFCDLTVSNPTQVNLPYPASDLSRAWAEARLFPYDPEAKGCREVRESLVQRMAPNHEVDHVWLTSSSSESYSYLFKLLCEAGDEVLIPTPSYPLFEGLSHLEGVTCKSFRLQWGDTWRMDEDSLRGNISERTKAILVVHPNNPTGNYLHETDRDFLFRLCEERNLALIVDEVFLPFSLAGDTPRSLLSYPPSSFPLFVLGGFSKQLGLPQMKLAWIMGHLHRDLADGLDWIADHFLSVPPPLQSILPQLWDAGASMQPVILSRLRENFSRLEQFVREHAAFSLLPCEGGWNAILRLGESLDEDELALHLMEHERVLVFPGYYFDLPFPTGLVMSLLPDPTQMNEGLRRLGRGLQTFAVK